MLIFLLAIFLSIARLESSLYCRIYFNPTGGKKSVKYPNGCDISADEFPKVATHHNLWESIISCVTLKHLHLILRLASVSAALLRWFIENLQPIPASHCMSVDKVFLLALMFRYLNCAVIVLSMEIEKRCLQDWFEGLQDEQYKGTR